MLKNIKLSRNSPVGLLKSQQTHVVIDVEACLPICVTVTKAGYGESRTLRPFVDIIHERYPVNMEKILADSGYDGNLNRLTSAGDILY